MDDLQITDFTINGKCSNCGSCCGNVLPLSQSEVERIRKYLQWHEVKEQRREGLTGVNLTCPFRDERRKKCLIYPARPDICKAFLCNHTTEDIKRSKMDFHKTRRIAYMREEFFGNSETRDFMNALFDLAFEKLNRGELEV